jgi:hypothetical protein
LRRRRRRWRRRREHPLQKAEEEAEQAAAVEEVEEEEGAVEEVVVVERQQRLAVAVQPLFAASEARACLVRYRKRLSAREQCEFLLRRHRRPRRSGIVCHS